MYSGDSEEAKNEEDEKMVVSESNPEDFTKVNGNGATEEDNEEKSNFLQYSI